MALDLYSFKCDPRAMKALIAAQYNGVAINTPDFDVKKAEGTPEFLAKSPAGKVPFLETPSGTIFESNAIARYVARLRRDTDLYGVSFFDSGSVDAWVDFVSNEVELPACMWVFPVLGWLKYDADCTEQSRTALLDALAVMERHLLYKTYLVGEKVTLADIVAACALFYPMKLVLDPATRAAFPSVERWFVTVTAQPQFAAVMGAEVPLCTEEVLAKGAGKGAKGKGKQGKGKQGQGKGQQGQGKGKGKKQQQEGKKGKKAEKAEEKKEEAPKPAKKKDPFADLPKSSMVLDEWKRHYSNSRSDYYKSMPRFWDELLDKEGWSIWFQKYNYNEENTVDYAVSNLVGGYQQRCDGIRKYAFGAMAILGEKPYEIEGCWLLRGQDIKPMMEANAEAEYYTWTKMNPDNEQERQHVADLWCAMEEVDGKALFDSKVFK